MSSSNNYQQSLFVSGVPEHFTYDEVCDRIDDRNWGRVKEVILLPVSKKVTYGPNIRSVIIHYTFWYKECELERRDLSRGMYLRLFYNKDEYWKAIAYDPLKQRSKIQTKKSETIKVLQRVMPAKKIVVQEEEVQQSEPTQKVDMETANKMAAAIIAEVLAETVTATATTTIESVVEPFADPEVEIVQKQVATWVDIDNTNINSIKPTDYGESIMPPIKIRRGRPSKKVTVVV